MELFLLVCVGCDSEFILDRRCYRGHQYCCPKCAQQGREESLARANAAYDTSVKGRKNHRDRENRRRQKKKKTQGVEAKKLTDQCSPVTAQECTIENEVVAPTESRPAVPADDAEPRRVTLSRETSSETRSGTDTVLQRSEAGASVLSCCCLCGAAGQITRWEVRPGSGRRGVWALVARLGTRGGRSRGLAGLEHSHCTPWRGVKTFG